MLGWWMPRTYWSPEGTGHREGPRPDHGEAGRRQLWEVLQAEAAGREVEALHSELALARVRARAGEARLERGKGQALAPGVAVAFAICAAGRWAWGSWGLDDCGQG